MCDMEVSDGGASVPVTRRLVAAMTDQLVASLREAAVIQHPTEVGRARENLVRDYLELLIPPGFGAATGFVIDSIGEVSAQQDIIVYRRDYHPSFAIGGVQYFPVEAVPAVIEVKSTLSTAALITALENGRSVKNLDRSGQGHNYIVAGGIGGVRPSTDAVSPEIHEHQVFTAIVGATGVAPDTAVTTLRSYLSGNQRQLWPNTVSTIDRWSIQYSNNSGRPPSDAMSATGLQVNDGDDRAPILDLVQQLWSFLRVTPVVDVAPARYLPPFGSRRVLDFGI